MAKNKLSARKLSNLQDAYLEEREQLLIKKVDKLSITLFDKIYTNYLKNLELDNGKLLNNSTNLELVKGLDSIYKKFANNENVKVVKSFVEDLQGITPLNENYFSHLTDTSTKANAERVNKVINKRIGIDEKGVPIKNGFIDKFIRDQSVIKKIKKQTMQAITKGKGFQEFRNELKETVQGVPNKPLSGGLQQYYRNYAYDTYIKVDRASAQLFAEDLGLRYFYYTGGIIATSRPLCEQCNGKIIDGNEWQNLTFDELKTEYQDGLPNGDNEVWDPLEDLGGYGCRHRKRYILTSLAEQSLSQMLNISDLLG